MLLLSLYQFTVVLLFTGPFNATVWKKDSADSSDMLYLPTPSHRRKHIKKDLADSSDMLCLVTKPRTNQIGYLKDGYPVHCFTHTVNIEGVA